MCTISFLSSVYMILPTIEFVLKDNVGESAAVLLPALVCDSLFFLVLSYCPFLAVAYIGLAGLAPDRRRRLLPGPCYTVAVVCREAFGSSQ